MPPEPVELHTARLLLRPYSLQDVDAVFAYMSDEEYAFFALPAAPSRESVERMIAARLQTPWQQRPHFAIVHDRCVIGDIGLRIDAAEGTADFGYGIARQHWGKGLATEAAEAVVDYGFCALGLAKIWARVDPRNAASLRVLDKLGFRREGLLRKHLVRRGERVDRMYYGLLREEWGEKNL